MGLFGGEGWPVTKNSQGNMDTDACLDALERYVENDRGISRQEREGFRVRIERAREWSRAACIAIAAAGKAVGR